LPGAATWGLEAVGTTAAGVTPEYRSLLEPDSGRGGLEEMVMPRADADRFEEKKGGSRLVA